MAIAPTELKRIVSDLLDVSELEISGFDEPNAGAVALASGARAVAAQDSVGQARRRAVRPGDFENGGPVGRPDAGGLGAGARRGHVIHLAQAGRGVQGVSRRPGRFARRVGAATGNETGESACANGGPLPYPEALAQSERSRSV